MKNMHGVELEGTRKRLMEICSQQKESVQRLERMIAEGAHPDALYRENEWLNTLIRREESIANEARRRKITLKELYIKEEGA